MLLETVVLLLFQGSNDSDGFGQVAQQTCCWSEGNKYKLLSFHIQQKQMIPDAATCRVLDSALSSRAYVHEYHLETSCEKDDLHILCTS